MWDQFDVKADGAARICGAYEIASAIVQFDPGPIFINSRSKLFLRKAALSTDLHKGFSVAVLGTSPT